jgi:hypothetical protein
MSVVTNILTAVPSKKEKLSLSVTHPELAKEADGWDPTSFRPGSNKIVRWKCPEGHTYSSAISKRTYRTDGCPFCSNHRLLIGFNDLRSKFHNLAVESFEWDPSEVKFNEMSPPRKWRCGFGHVWEASCNSRINGGGCHVCQGDLVIDGINDLSTTHPELAISANGWDPTSYSSGSDAKKEWLCPKGHLWTASIASRVNGSGCSYCGKKKVDTGINDLETTFPAIATEAYQWDPAQVFPFSNKKLTWLCPKGHIFLDTPNHRTIRLTGCTVCSNHQVLVGFNDLQTTNPGLAAQAYLWDPSSVTAGSSKKKVWKCKEGHLWHATVASRKNSGCPTCAKYGFDPNENGYLYFLQHKDWNMQQIGITNFPERRLKSHKKLRWELLELRGPMDGHLAQQWETAILRMLKVKGADLSNDKIVGRFDGYSEAWSKSTFEVSSIKELMRLTEDFENEVNN